MKITKRQLRRIIKEELLQEWRPETDLGSPDQGDPRARYVALIKDIGPEQFVEGLVAALGDVSGYSDGHAGIIDYIGWYTK